MFNSKMLRKTFGENFILEEKISMMNRRCKTFEGNFIPEKKFLRCKFYDVVNGKEDGMAMRIVVDTKFLF